MTDVKSPMCEEVEAELGRILDGVAAQELYDHLADCDACRDLRHDAQRALVWVKTAGDDFQPIEALDAKILAALDARSPAVSDGASAKPDAPPVAPTLPGAPSVPALTAPSGGDSTRAEDRAAATTEQKLAPLPATTTTASGEPGRVIRFVAFGGLLVAAAAGVAVMQRAPQKPGVDAETAEAAPWSGKVASLARASSEAKDGFLACDPSGICAPLAAGATVARGATLKTDARTRAEVRLVDGSTIALDHDTELSFAKSADRTATLTRGSIVADVAHIDGANAKLTVPGGSLEVLGTKLAVFGERDRSRVEVSRGVVALSDDAGNVEKIRAGEEGRVAKGRKITVAPTTTLAEDLAWSERSLRPAKTEKDPEEPLRGLGELRAKKPGTQDEKDTAVHLVKHDVKVRIVDNVARTEIDETFQNETGDELEGIFRFPLPPDAQIERLALEVAGKLEEGAFVEKDKAAAIWRGVIQNAAPRMPKPVEEIIWVPGPWRDPALLEWKRGGRFELRIFPIPARGSRRLVLAYTQTVQPVGGLRRYTYPLAYDPKGSTTVAAFHLDAKVTGNDASVPLSVRGYEKDATAQGDRVELNASRFVPSGDLTIEYALPDAAAEVSAWAYQPPGAEAGAPYALIAVRPKLPRVKGEAARETVLVVDASRSMVGERLAKARTLVSSMVAEMDPRDRVLVLACDETCRSWDGGLAEAGPRASANAERFLASVTADGAADLSAMVRAAVDAAAKAGRDKSRAFHVVYVGDGGASAGPTKPDHLTAEIKRAAGDASVHAVAIGSDADTTLLAAFSRGGGGVVVPFVPGQRASVAAVAALAATYGLTLRQPTFELPAGFDAVAPATLDTMRAGGETLIVARMSARDVEGEAVLRGKVSGEAFEQRYPLHVTATSDEGNAFVPRQYAALRIADLERAGGDAAKTSIIDLSKRFAVASRYTSLLVLESEAMLTAFGLKRQTAMPSWTGETAATRMNADGTVEIAGGDADALAKGKSPSDALDVGGLGFSGVGESSNTRGLSAAPGHASGAAASSPRSMAKDDDFAAPPPAAKAAPMPSTAPPPLADSPRDEKKRAEIAGPARRPPSMPPSRPRVWIPMKRVWDRKATIASDVGAWHDRESAKTPAAESDAITKPDSRAAIKTLFGAYALHGRLDRASDIAERWASRDALDPEALVARADLAARGGDREAAVRILGGTADVRPDDAVAQNRLASVYDQLGLRERSCAHRVALAEQRASDVEAQAAAVRCARATGQSELADRLLADVASEKRLAVERALEKTPDAPADLKGDVRLEATWDADEDLDVALIDKNGARLSWMGAGKLVTTVRLAVGSRSEALGIVNLGAGSYLVEVTRTKPSSDPSAIPVTVRGSMTLRVAGETRTVPFIVVGPRAEVAKVEVTYQSRLVPVD